MYPITKSLLIFVTAGIFLAGLFNNDFEVLWAKNENLRQRFLGTCQQMLRDPRTKNEALKLGCGNVQFDGADPNLSPLEEKDIKPPFQAQSR